MAMLVALVAVYLPLAHVCKQHVYRRTAASHRTPLRAAAVADVHSS
jgi:hypothetical protein